MSNEDALLVIEAALSHKVPLIERRPLDRERAELIRLGNVFVFIEEHSDIKRWTDGITWLASRILGRFLIYRKLDKQGLLGKEDKRKSKRAHLALWAPELKRPLLVASVSADSAPTKNSYEINGKQDHYLKHAPAIHVTEDRGLIKKTLLLTIVDDAALRLKQNVHLISYYLAHDVIAGNLLRPLQTDLRTLTILQALHDAIRRLSLGSKVPQDAGASFFLDSNYQLQNMAALLANKDIGSKRRLSAHAPAYPSLAQRHSFADEPSTKRSRSLYLESDDSFQPPYETYQYGYFPHLGLVTSLTSTTPVHKYLPAKTLEPQPFFQPNFHPLYDDRRYELQPALVFLTMDPAFNPVTATSPAYRHPDHPEATGYEQYSAPAIAPLNNSAFGLQTSSHQAQHLQTPNVVLNGSLAHLNGAVQRFDSPTTVANLGVSASRLNQDDPEYYNHEDYA